MSGQKKLKVAKSKWFDIIYAQKYEETAKLLYSKADLIYEEVAAQYGIKPQCRMPVVITQSVESFNANWSCIPYNHVVIYDTSEIQDLSVFSEGLLSTFRHEITHSVTYNMKNGFWKGLDYVLGDAMYLGAVTISGGMAEGATLTSESAAGEGRLNNSFSMHSVRQAKIEKKFPSYFDVQGASDKYPAGSYYYFNGAFHQWLQNKYGLEKYAEFWYRLINFQSISARGAFYKTYGIKLKKAWKEFENAFEVAQIEENPVKAGISADYFDSEKNGYTFKNNQGAVISQLSKAGNFVIYADTVTDAVYSLENGVSKKLFTVTGLRNAKLSNDGRFITCVYYSQQKYTTKSCLKIYDVQNKSFINFDKTNIHDAVVVKTNEDYFLICKEYESPRNKICSYKLEFKGKKVRDFTESAFLLFKDVNTVPQNLLALENGKLSFILRKGLEYSICIYDCSLNCEKEAFLPENRAVQYLSEYEGRLYFSWADKTTMVRLGAFDIEEGGFFFSQKDISGGIFTPVCIQNNGKNEVLYAGKFYRQDRILVLKDFEALFNNENKIAAEKLSKTETEKRENQTEIFKDEEFLSKNYNPFRYYLKGIFIPYSICKSNSYDINHQVSYSLPYGATYISSNPWTDGLLYLSAGYGLSTDSFGFEANYSSGSNTDIFKYKVKASTEFDDNGWKQSDGNLTVNSLFPFGNVSGIILQNTLQLHYGRSNLNASDASALLNEKLSNESNILEAMRGYAKASDSKKFGYVLDTVSLSYTNIHKAGDGKYSNIGFSAGVAFATKYNAEDAYDEDNYSFANDLGFFGLLYLPKLLPVPDNYNYTYNLPVRIRMCLFTDETDSSSSMNYISGNTITPKFNAAYASVKSVLFAADVQKGSGLFLLNDYRFVFNYKCGFSYSSKDNFSWRIQHLKQYVSDLNDGNVPLEHYLSLRFTAGITPNYGILANSAYKTDFFFEFGVGYIKNIKSDILRTGFLINL